MFVARVCLPARISRRLQLLEKILHLSLHCLQKEQVGVSQEYATYIPPWRIPQFCFEL